MSLHHTQKKKYQGMKDAGMTADELRQEMLDNEIASEDVESFISEAYSDVGSDSNEPSGQSTPPADTGEEKPKNAKPKFDYKALEGKHLEDYHAHVASLPLFEQRQFQCFKAEQVRKERYPGMPGSPWDVVGIRIINDTPVHTTKISIKTANELNAQLPNSGRIYLLKQ